MLVGRVHRDVLAHGLAGQLGHGTPRPRCGEGEVPSLVGDLGRGEHVERHSRDEFLGEGHHVLEVPVRGVELEHRELGVVARAHAFVAKDAAQLEDPLEPAHHQALQPQFGSDAQVELAVEGVVKRLERFRRRPGGDRVEHWRLHLHEPGRPAALAHGADHRAASKQRRSRRGIGPQVRLAMAVAQVDIGDAGPLLAEVVQRVR